MIALILNRYDVASAVGIYIAHRELAISAVFDLRLIAELPRQMLDGIATAQWCDNRKFLTVEQHEAVDMAAGKGGKQHFQMSSTVPLADVQLFFDSICLVAAGLEYLKLSSSPIQQQDGGFAPTA